MSELNISATDVTSPRTWEQTSCKPPSCQGHHQMSGKTITVPHRCEEESSLLHEQTSSTLNSPALTDARDILCINMAGGRLYSSGRSADNNPDAEVFMSSPLMPSLPACWSSQGKNMTLLTTIMPKWKKTAECSSWNKKAEAHTGTLDVRC